MFSNFPRFRPLFGCLSAAAMLAAIVLFRPGLLSAQSSTVIYVRPAATGAGDGSSWANATTLQDALQNRASADDEIWLAAGVYIPGSDPLDTFELIHGVAVYGGFAGNETAREQRDPAANLTVFSGDIGGDDRNKSNGITPTADDIVGTNTRNLVVISRAFWRNTIDGITLTGGQATGSASFCTNSPNGRNSCGGGMFADGSAILSNLRFIGIQARRDGGGLYADGLVQLTSGTGDRAVISDEHVQVTNVFLDNLVAAGSSELQQMLSQERATIQLDNLVGQTMNEATRNVIDVDPAELDLGEPVFLPYVTCW
jgi:hypothetical protein